MNHSKTEREGADTVVNLVEKEGFTDLAALVRDKKKLKAGDKVYATWMNKAVILCRIGEKPMEEGMNIVASHIDSPRLDIKPNPLYENTGVAYMDTHYYGRIKKYQWVTLPLAILCILTIINIFNLAYSTLSNLDFTFVSTYLKPIFLIEFSSSYVALHYPQTNIPKTILFQFS